MEAPPQQRAPGGRNDLAGSQIIFAAADQHRRCQHLLLHPAQQHGRGPFATARGAGFVTDMTQPLAGCLIVTVTKTQGGDDLLAIECKIGGGRQVSTGQVARFSVIQQAL